MLRLLMGLLMLVMMALVFTQILLPALQGRLLFPLLRSRLRKAETDLASKKTDKHIRAMEASAIRIDHEGQQQVHEALDELIEEPASSKTLNN